MPCSGSCRPCTSRPFHGSPTARDGTAAGSGVGVAVGVTTGGSGCGVSVATGGTGEGAAIAEAAAAVKAAGAEAQLRVPRTPTEQLSVTHYFAAQGYGLVVGVGLDRDVAVAPVAAEYPRTRFVAVEPGQIARALAD